MRRNQVTAALALSWSAALVVLHFDARADSCGEHVFPLWLVFAVLGIAIACPIAIVARLTIRPLWLKLLYLFPTVVVGVLVIVVDLVLALECSPYS